MQIPFEKIYEADLIHPLEQKSIQDCQKNLLYDWLADQCSALKNRVDDRAEATLNLYPVTKFTAPHLNQLYELALKRLDCKEKFPLYINFDYGINFEVSGSPSESYVIKLSSVSFEELTNEEILALLGQALGRIKANHVQNLQLLKILENVVGSLPLIGPAAEKELWSSFAAWNISALFSIDRAALFACGSERAVVSLILKQNGLTTNDFFQILNQDVKKSDDLGIYFIWLMQSLPVFGGIERIQELRRWVRSESFKNDYPGFYHKNLLEDKIEDEETTSLLELHRLAINGNVRAMVTLADKYFKGEELPKSKFMAENFYKMASFNGDARAMYIFAKFLDFDSKGKNKKFVRRLYEAAASRDFQPALQKVIDTELERQDNLMEKVCNDFFIKHKNQTVCKIKSDLEEYEQIRRAFWINQDEKIFAQETFVNVEGEIFGIAITATGIYGRLSEESLPYHVAWKQMRNEGLEQRWLSDNKKYLTLGETALYCVEKSFQGTVAEVIINIALNLRNN